MGLVLIAGLFAGCALGAIVTAIVGCAGIALTFKSAKTSIGVWWCFAVVSLALLLLGIVIVHEYPYATVQPGSDYDVAMKNYFLQGLGYGASPGLASLFAAMATLLMPKKSAATPLAASQVTGTKTGSDAQ